GCDQLLVAGTTPLIRAAKTFDYEAVALLIEHGAVVDLPQFLGITPLIAAAGGGSWDCDARGSAILVAGGNRAQEQRAIAAIDALLDAGADINARMMGTFGLEHALQDEQIPF